MIYKLLVRPLLFRCDPEWVHDKTIALAERAAHWPRLTDFFAKRYQFRNPRLQTTFAAVTFQNPVGLAAGFDKSGRAVDLMSKLGFGHLEIGSVSAFPSAGNERPRLWRLPRDRAICVHYGLPNDGAAAVAERISNCQSSIPLGINLVNTNRGANAKPATVEEILEDYVRSAEQLSPYASYLMVNLSCPNTEDGRDFFASSQRVTDLLSRMTSKTGATPIFLKISPDWELRAIDSLVEIAEHHDQVSGFMFNLSSKRRDGLTTPSKDWRDLPGAISGSPTRTWMNEKVRELYRRLDSQRFKIIAAGGISNADDAYQIIRSGASMVQVYTGLVYEGPGLVRTINRGLIELLDRDGLSTIEDAVGVDSR